MSNVEEILKSFAFVIWLPTPNHETQINKQFKFIKHKFSSLSFKGRRKETSDRRINSVNDKFHV
jgi:hypothetical protein